MQSFFDFSSALILIGRVLDPGAFANSALYDPAHVHLLRPARRAPEPEQA